MLAIAMAPRTLVVSACLFLLGVVPAADARPSMSKGIWGPVRVDGVSQFPIYAELGAGVYNTSLNWATVAPERPSDPRNPADPAYRWPAELDDATAEAGRHGIRVALLVSRSPAWANGGRTSEWVPRASHYADFLAAAARRYPAIRHWILWGEPTRSENFKPIPPTHPSRPLGAVGRRTVRLYGGLLDAGYAALKRVSRRNVVIGGNSFTGGDISPFNWIRYMRLANGKRPRMDLYGHNPFTFRRPRLSAPLIRRGYADFSDLDALAGWLDRFYGPDPRRKPMRIWLGEFLVPTDHRNHEFNGYVTREVQASWLSDALRITRRSGRIATLNWLGLYDDPPRPRGDEVNRGLIDIRGRRKPAFGAFARG